MVEKNNKLLPGQRVDGYEGQYTDSGNPIREKWIHKQVPKMLGDKEDDFVIIEKPVLIEKANIQKEIEEQAKACPKIKELVSQVMDTGDESILVNCQGTYGDVTEMPTDLHEAIRTVRQAKEKGFNLDDDKILSMSKDELNKLIDEAVKKMVAGSQPKPKEDKTIEEPTKTTGDDKGGTQ